MALSNGVASIDDTTEAKNPIYMHVVCHLLLNAQEVATGMDRLTAMSVLGQHGSEISSTPRSHRRGFTSQQALAWLQLPDIVSGVSCAKVSTSNAFPPIIIGFCGVCSAWFQWKAGCVWAQASSTNKCS